LAVKVVLPPAQKDKSPEIDAGTELTIVTVAESDAEHVSKVAVTLYTVVNEGVAITVLPVVVFRPDAGDQV